MDFIITEKNATICLNMIVKNEAHIIENTLEKLCTKIQFDYWVICDTGSTDNTPKMITAFFEKKGIKGELFYDEWVNFAHNRTLALQRAYKKTNLLLVFDADDEIVGDLKIPTEVLFDEYHFQFGSAVGINYTRVLMINNYKQYEFLSVIHEFISCKEGPAKSAIISGNYYVISGRTGSRSLDPDKYLKDALILEKAHGEALKTNNHLFHRYAFYCANSYKDCGKIEDAIKWYKITLGQEKQWAQEKYMSCLNIYDCYQKLGEQEKGFFYLVKAFEYDTERVECLFPLLVHYCCANMNRVAYNYYLNIKDFFENRYLHTNISNKLFTIQDKYDFFVPYYMILIADKVQDFECVVKMYEIVFIKKQRMFDEWYVRNFLYNLQFFLQHVPKHNTQFIVLANEYIKFVYENGVKIHNFDFWSNPTYKNAGLELDNYLITEVTNTMDKYGIQVQTNKEIDTIVSLTDVKKETLRKNGRQLNRNTDTDIQLDFTIGFHSNQLCERGTEIAMYDYAYYNQKLYGNKSVIFYCKHSLNNDSNVIAKFEKEFKCYAYDNFSDIDKFILDEKIDYFYNIKGGKKSDNQLVTKCPNLIHAVFTVDPHGDKYATISKQLSLKYNNIVDYVPHMINLPECSKNMRIQLNIPENAIVLGRIGGFYQFDLKIAHNAIKQIVEIDSNIFFLFVNTNKFYEHPQIIYLNKIIVPIEKVTFINTCDAMIHARSDGETFGLAIAEFSSLNKPVITSVSNMDNSHIEILGSKGIIYDTEDSLMEIFKNIRTIIKLYDDWNAYKEYTPEIVMKKFMDVFISNDIKKNNINYKTIEYIDMNQVAPSFKNNKTDLVMVTGFLDINRENWTNYQRTTTQYIESFINYFNYPAKMIIFVDDKYFDKIKELYEKSSHNNSILIPINRQWMNENIYAWQQLDKSTNIMNSEYYKNLVNTRIQNGTPENIYPEYNAINHSKIDFICYAINNNLINEDSFICWSDFGYFNSILNNNPNEYPLFSIDIQKFDTNKLSFCLRNKLDDLDQDMIYTLLKAPEKITGSFFAGPSNLMVKLQELYHQSLNEIYTNNISDDDQHIYLRCFLKEPQVFNLYLDSTKWPEGLIYFQKSDSENIENISNYDHKPLFLVTSLINLKKNTLYSSEERLLQTIKTIKSIYNYCPNAIVVILEASDYKYSDELIDLFKNLYIYYITTNVTEIHKSIGESIIIKEFVNTDLYNSLINTNKINIVFKISGRYLLNEHFKITNFNLDKHNFRFVNSFTDEYYNLADYNKNYNSIDMFCVTCLFSFNPNNRKEILDSLNYVIENVVKNWYDIEHQFYRYFHNKDCYNLIENLGISGFISPTGQFINY